MLYSNPLTSETVKYFSKLSFLFFKSGILSKSFTITAIFLFLEFTSLIILLMSSIFISSTCSPSNPNGVKLNPNALLTY